MTAPLNYESKYLAFMLDAKSRQELLAAFSPMHQNVIAEHVTIEFNITDKGIALMSDKREGLAAVVYGHAANARVQCVGVVFDERYTRSDGGLYHVTISCAKGARPVESNHIVSDAYANRISHGVEGLKLTGELMLRNK